MSKRWHRHQELRLFPGGLGTKIHTLSDSLDNQIRLVFTDSQYPGFIQALPLLDQRKVQAVILLRSNRKSNVPV